VFRHEQFSFHGLFFAWSKKEIKIKLHALRYYYDYIYYSYQQKSSRSCNILLLRKLLLTPWPESASELYQPSDCGVSAKLVSASADRGSHVVRVTDPYGSILVF
jgi:hypothetical protein